jgi:hypothetical protein
MGRPLNGIPEVDGSIPFSSTRTSLSLARDPCSAPVSGRRVAGNLQPHGSSAPEAGRPSHPVSVTSARLFTMRRPVHLHQDSSEQALRLLRVGRIRAT